MSIVKLIHKPLSDADIRKILGHDTKIIKYSELAKFSNLNELLQEPKDYCVILYEDSTDRGHWTGLSKYNGTFEHFDSYGLKPDRELGWISMKRRRLLHEDRAFLSRLLEHETHVYNSVRYQQLDSGVNTCGSHVVHRLFRLKNNDMDLDKYHNFMSSLKEDFNTSYDMIVAEFVKQYFPS